MSDAAKLAALIRVSDASFIAAQTRMASLRSKEQALRAQLSQLSADRKQLAEKPRDGSDPALIAGAEDRWLQWIASRQTALNVELARLQAMKAQHFAELKRAFGRRQAMRAVTVKLQQADAQKRARRIT